MSGMIANVAKATATPLFSRHARMLGWVTSGAAQAAALYSKDGLHMNDASYRCLARDLADMLAPAPRVARVGVVPAALKP